MSPARFTFEAIGTSWDIQFLSEKIAPEDLFLQIRSRIDLFDSHYSRFRNDSLVSQIAKAAGTYEMPPDWEKLWSVYTKLYGLTDGAFTPCVGSMLEDIGYDAHYSLERKAHLRPAPPLEKVASYIAPILHTSEPILFDVGAAGKGYLVDIVGDLMKESGVTAYTINAGGDILHYGTSTFRVGLENPDNTDEVLGVFNLGNESVCGSAGNRRQFGSFHHILDPRTKTSPQHIKAVWVVAPTALIADALATALYFVDPGVLIPHFEFEWAILSPDQSVRFSERFSDVFFN